MVNKVKGLIFHPLFFGSMVMIIGQNIVNVGQYFYHLAMGRLLGPQSYGDLAAIISLSGLLGMIPFSLGLVIVKFISSTDEKKKITNFISWFEKKSLLFGATVGLVVFLTSPFIAKFLQISNFWLVSFIGPMFLLGIVTFFNRASLQGLMRFGKLVSTLLTEVVVKLGSSILLVYLGYSVFGALAGAFLGGIFAFFLSHLFIKDYLSKITRTPEIGPLLKYAVPVVLMTIATTSIYSTDLVLVKHFFDSYDAGLYASLSTLGKIVLFGVSPISTVMFPLVAKRQSRGHGYRKIFLYSFLLALAIAGVVLLIYFLFPEIAISFLFGSSYLEAAPYLFKFGVFIAVLAISVLYLNFYISLGRTRIVFLPLLAALVQAFGIWFFHDSILTVIKVSLVSVSFLLTSLLIYFGYDQYQKQSA